METVLDSFKDYMIKLDAIEKELNSIKPLINTSEIKVVNEITKGFQINTDNLKKLAQYIGSLAQQVKNKDIENDKRLERVETEIKNVSTSFKSTKDELIKNQEGLYSIINSLVVNKSDIQKAQISLQDSKIKTEATKEKNKLIFWAKIIGIVFGSGGILFFIIKFIMESLL